ncbi:MutS-related protein [Cardinium endosymbiont of Culicoides punctatus]|uniref:MutS-related protein n=1 Tax=Cardinium endosymbiont of Culicoides punctatus TaxID=2304601 RepID=UPI00105886C1|nr:hypothetical protein [Cardinium endosymbiont of Culicoides punctatus]TDG95587.1 DNA mismatch repair protein MutS [Cardinium endosymbiont of Culicoides punctatus]
MRILKQLTFAFSLHSFIASADTTAPKLAELADIYLKSFHEEVKKNDKPEDHKESFNKNITDVTLSPREERVVVFNEIFAKSNVYQDRHKHIGTVLNQYAWNDLHLFCGTTTTPDYHFLSRINKTITTLGEISLATFVSAPIANLDELIQRQQIVHYLYRENQVAADLKNQLQNYKKVEKGMLSFWTETDPLYNKEYDKYLTDLFYTQNPISNKSATSLQTRKFWLRDLWNIYSNYIWYPLLGAVSGELVVAFSPKELTHSFYYKKFYPMFFPGYGLYHISNLNLDFDDNRISNHSIRNNNSTGGMKSVFYFYSAGLTIHSLWQYYKGYRNYKEYSGVLNHLALRMADIQTFLITAKQINRLVQDHPELEELYGKQLVAIRALLASSKEKTPIGNLLCYLEELPLRSWSYFKDNAGKLLASYRLFVAYKDIFHDAMYELGELDAFVAVATLMHETDAMGAPHTYSFTKLLAPKEHSKPCFTFTEMWNPMLDPVVAIGNDIAMGRETSVRNVILTGPNAGGKSTFLTGVLETILLSQTFGIAPAKSCTMTPFNKISTYIDVTDDIAAGKSLFVAEVERFQRHLSLLKGLKKDECCFTIFDEPFSGTNPKEGEATEYSVLNFIAQYSNALSIVATHYPIIMLLEKNEPTKGFKNYKVFIHHKGRGHKIEYTYKVIPGESNQAIAIDILEEEGYPMEMLAQTRDILKHPEKYQKDFTTYK